MAAVIRPAAEGDRADVHRVVVTAFGDEGSEVSAMVEALEAAGHVRSSLVAVVDGRVVGHVMLSHAWLSITLSLIHI